MASRPVLLVDAHETCRNALALLLEHSGYAVVEAGRGDVRPFERRSRPRCETLPQMLLKTC